MGIKHKKLMKWVEAGLLSESQADAIQAYENKSKEGRFGRGLIGLSIFAILAGVLLIIGSNWHLISSDVKIGVHVLLNAGVAYAAWRAMQAGRDLWREGLTLAFFGLTFTFILLIGQIYHLSGTAAAATAFWLIITLPFMAIFAKDRITAVAWMAAFLTTVYLCMAEYVKELPDEWEELYYIGVTALLPLVLIADGNLKIFQQWKPAWADIFLKTGLVLLTISACFATVLMNFSPYFAGDDEVITPLRAYLINIAPFIVGAIGIGVHAVLHNFYRGNETLRLGALFVAVSFAVQALPFLLNGKMDGALFAAILFIGYWVFIGWIGQQMDRPRLISLAIVFIAIRIFWVYVELFGSMMETGFGLILGGGVMLGLIYGAAKLNKRLTKGTGAGA